MWRSELEAAGEPAPMPSFRKPPNPAAVPFWNGGELPAEMPPPAAYIRCRPCDCEPGCELVPWDGWQELNRAAYAYLRRASAPYPVIIVPGFHGGGAVTEYRLRHALRLLRHGWAAAILLSGGHRRGGGNEARAMISTARRLAKELEVDLTGRIILEPCAAVTLTNLRNSLRLLAAWRLPRALLLTDSKMTGQALVFYHYLERLVPDELQCRVGRVSYLRGSGPLPSVAGQGTGCQPRLSFTNNPVGFMLPRRSPALFWVSPLVKSDESPPSTSLECRGGSAELVAKEPDDQDPLRDPCLPVLGASTLVCPQGAIGAIRDELRAVREKAGELVTGDDEQATSAPPSR